MKNSVLKLLFFLSLLLNSICISIAQESDNSFCRLVDSLVNQTGKISLKLKGDFNLTRQNVSNEIRKLEFENATDFIFIRVRYNIEDSMAVKIISDKKFLIENLFTKQPSPYPDIVSKEVGCPDRLKPLPFDTIYTNIKISAFRLYANDRFIFGECTDDVIVYTSAFIMAYNIKEKILTEIKYFTPKSSPVNIPEDVMRSVRW